MGDDRTWSSCGNVGLDVELAVEELGKIEGQGQDISVSGPAWESAPKEPD